MADQNDIKNIYREGNTCWKLSRAEHVSIIVDYGNYYRNLHESIIKAQHSIFVLGWDIDSRIKLLRGEAAEKADAPVTFYDLICWKARQNPDIQIYLNRWDYSLFFMRQREPFAVHRWASAELPNIHYCLDDMLPLAACHHQKLVVVDDETAFWGGMDVALARWDFRQHHIDNAERCDPAQLPALNKEAHFDPYHDIQAVLSGPAARLMAEHVRMRWRAVCEVEPLPMRIPDRRGVPPSWPDSDPPDFYDVDVALARTMPKTRSWQQTEEIAKLWPEEIARAEHFIYIENQFLACDMVARALNKRLREKPQLRVMIVSCYNPQGMMERKAMWGGRVRFRDILESGGVADRVVMAYPTCHENGKDAVVRVHSKLMIVDDRILHLGSANINNRSLGMDTEFDVSLIGEGVAARAKIAAVRNDLIREHTGYKTDVIARIVDEGGSVQTFLQDCAGSRQHLRRIDDEKFRQERFYSLIKAVADPRKPLVPAVLTRIPRKGKRILKGRAIWAGGLVLLMLLALSFAWSHTPLAQYVSAENLERLMQRAQAAPLALLWVTLIYVIGGLLFFPVTGLSAAVIIVFGGVKGFIYSLVGAVASGLTGYMIGAWIGQERLSRIFPNTGKIMKKIKGSGVVGVAVVRTLPVAPYSLVNLVYGVAGISIFAFVLGSVLGLFPGKIMLAIFGDSMMEAIRHPEPKNILLAVAGLIGWLVVVLMCNKLARKWESRHNGGDKQNG